MTVISLSRKTRQRARKVAKEWGFFDGKDAGDTWVSARFQGMNDDLARALADSILVAFAREEPSLFDALPEPKKVDHTIELLFEEVNLPKRERKALKRVLGDIYFKHFMDACDANIKRQCRFVLV